MLISLPAAILIKKMGVTVFSLLLTVHLDFKNKNAPYLERERRRNCWVGLPVTRENAKPKPAVLRGTVVWKYLLLKPIFLSGQELNFTELGLPQLKCRPAALVHSSVP